MSILNKQKQETNQQLSSGIGKFFIEFIIGYLSLIYQLSIQETHLRICKSVLQGLERGDYRRSRVHFSSWNPLALKKIQHRYSWHLSNPKVGLHYEPLIEFYHEKKIVETNATLVYLLVRGLYKFCYISNTWVAWQRYEWVYMTWFNYNYICAKLRIYIRFICSLSTIWVDPSPIRKTSLIRHRWMQTVPVHFVHKGLS